MKDRKSKFLAAIDKMQRDKRNFISAIKSGKSIADMEKEGLRFLNTKR